MIQSNEFYGYHSEWNLGSPGGWDYQRITQEIGRAVWKQIEKNINLKLELDFDHPLLHPVNGFVNMLVSAHFRKKGETIAVVAEEETLDSVVENKNLASHLNRTSGVKSVLIAPHQLELFKGEVCYQKSPISIIFMDFNTDVLLKLHRKHNLSPLLQAVQEGRVINPRGTEPINVKSMFEIITDPRFNSVFHPETIKRTPWTRRFFQRSTESAEGKSIKDLIEWTRKNWENLVLKPERGYSGIGVRVGGVHPDADAAIELALSGKHGPYIVQQKVPLPLWAETIPELDTNHKILKAVEYQTDFRCLFNHNGLLGFLCRYGHVPTNVGSGGGVQPLAILKSDISIRDATQRINDSILSMRPDDVIDVIRIQSHMALDNSFTYLLGPIKMALRPRLITEPQMDALAVYCKNIWKDCIKLEKMWYSRELDHLISIEPEELKIARSQPWRGSEAIIASDGIFSFGAHKPH
ncbi:hypothetical protein MHK_005149 [Candidatus Magnetomorum sp. HK-1]|nr:hypothetical protein MHK_005149 [Candidatus Magnetomorum sp. HK-1]